MVYLTVQTQNMTNSEMKGTIHSKFVYIKMYVLLSRLGSRCEGQKERRRSLTREDGDGKFERGRIDTPSKFGCIYQGHAIKYL